MQLVTKVKIARPVKIVVNSNNSQSHQWGQIKDAVTNQVLHTGRLPYIVRTARVRYNHEVSLS